MQKMIKLVQEFDRWNSALAQYFQHKNLFIYSLCGLQMAIQQHISWLTFSNVITPVNLLFHT